MNDCGPMLLATRSRRCANSATLSLSSKTGAGGVSLMFDGAAVSLVARTATPTEVSSARQTQTANRANATRILFDFLISILLLEQRNQTYCGGDGAGCGAVRRPFDRGGLRICRLPAFATRNLIPSGKVMICERSRELRMLTPPGISRMAGLRGTFGSATARAGMAGGWTSTSPS